MDFGVAIFPSHEIPDPGVLARLAEDRGFESILFPEHTHIPVARETPYPGGGQLPDMYRRTYDLFVSMAIAAAATSRIKVGAGICLIIERDPIIAAKEIASIDVLSGGRVLFGVGAGWNVEEMANHGTDPDTRFGRMRESVEAMTAIWTQDEAEYHGRHIDFDPIWSWPKPVQQPRPAVLIGGNGPKVLDRVLSFGDEWLPNAGTPEEPLLGRIAELQRRAREEFDRGPIPVTVFGIPDDPAVAERYAGAGVTRMVDWLPPLAGSALEQVFDETAAKAARLGG